MDEPFQKYKVNDMDYPGDLPVKPEPGVLLLGSTQVVHVAPGPGIALGSEAPILISGAWCSIYVSGDWIGRTHLEQSLFARTQPGIH